ncbi:uncharacterized protein BO80DRAFT_445832 [Aspergillus ibericus CBS 121593]|uniref:Uncharacterized protein n=1 Tax=Aspergillus ibericus CBS 121593 TaxID=1448316 RepID=A0A395GXQ0_9EURO|nr:hypothetical protein BO80DRAFT_445832 [Aspergillus ibericus CBS 121593]RAL00130.1 hypothetical protein BO80DRAFT_445832 [Aspergillus ibericus CBS 121593]
MNCASWFHLQLDQGLDNEHIRQGIFNLPHTLSAADVCEEFLRLLQAASPRYAATGKCGVASIYSRLYSLMQARFGDGFTGRPVNSRAPGSQFMIQFEALLLNLRQDHFPERQYPLIFPMPPNNPSSHSL